MLQAEWLSDPTVRPMDLKEVVANVLHGKLQPAPKIYFKYPKVCLNILSADDQPLNIRPSMVALARCGKRSPTYLSLIHI